MKPEEFKIEQEILESIKKDDTIFFVASDALELFRKSESMCTPQNLEDFEDELNSFTADIKTAVIGFISNLALRHAKNIGFEFKKTNGKNGS